MNLNTDMLLRKIVGSGVVGTIIWANPVALANAPNNVWVDGIQSAGAGVLGGAVAGFDMNTTWILRLAVSTAIGFYAGATLPRYVVALQGYQLHAVGAAAGFLGTSIWPDRHPLFN